MKKSATWLIVLLFPALSVFCQKIALTGGFTAANVTEKNQLLDWDSATRPHFSGRTGVHLGFLADIPVSADNKWFFQPGILYQPKGRKFFKMYDSATAELTDTFLSRKSSFFNYIEFPLNIAYKQPIGKQSFLVLTAGPYLSFFYNGKEQSQTRLFASNDFKEDEQKFSTGSQETKVKTMDLGMNARIGIETRTIYLSAFWSRGLSSFYESVYGGTFRHRLAGASLGFWLNKSKPIEKKLKDRDLDGIADENDGCPDVAGNLLTNGCPDTDGDAVADNLDKCPDVAGVSKFDGCPVPDTDKDGLNDEEDKCPDTAGSAKFGGCPVPDTDKDGLNDEVDACPEKPGVDEFNGCPIPDSDGDGVNDKDDKCPDEAGTTTNNGCPDVHQKMVEKVNLAARKIFYAAYSDKISAASYPALDEVASILKNNTDLKIEIEGHSDNSGQTQQNKLLSQKRAMAVKKYLETVGIEASRIRASGLGDKFPLTLNDTEAGRSRNRRVELILVKE